MSLNSEFSMFSFYLSLDGSNKSMKYSIEPSHLMDCLCLQAVHTHHGLPHLQWKIISGADTPRVIIFFCFKCLITFAPVR